MPENKETPGQSPATPPVEFEAQTPAETPTANTPRYSVLPTERADERQEYGVWDSALDRFATTGYSEDDAEFWREELSRSTWDTAELVDGIAVHTLDTTDGERAYAFTQCSDQFHAGDILVFADVVAIMYRAWPCAITVADHGLDRAHDGTWLTMDDGRYASAYRVAVRVAQERGLALAAPVEHDEQPVTGADADQPAAVKATARKRLTLAQLTALVIITKQPYAHGVKGVTLDALEGRGLITPNTDHAHLRWYLTEEGQAALAAQRPAEAPEVSAAEDSASTPARPAEDVNEPAAEPGDQVADPLDPVHLRMAEVLLDALRELYLADLPGDSAAGREYAQDNTADVRDGYNAALTPYAHVKAALLHALRALTGDEDRAEQLLDECQRNGQDVAWNLGLLAPEWGLSVPLNVTLVPGQRGGADLVHLPFPRTSRPLPMCTPGRRNARMGRSYTLTDRPVTCPHCLIRNDNKAGGAR